MNLVAVRLPSQALGLVDELRRGLPRRLRFDFQRELGEWVGQLRGRYFLAIDLALIVVAAWAAMALRLDRIDAALLVPGFPVAVGVLLVVRTIVNVRCGLYSRRWRHASVPELERILEAVLIGSLLSILAFSAISLATGEAVVRGFPRTFWLVEPLLSSLTLGGLRLSIRAATEAAPTGRLIASAGTHATLLYGAGETGSLLARSALRHGDAGVVPVGFLDDDPRLRGAIVAGLRVHGGIECMEHAMTVTRAGALLITMPSASGKAVRRVVDRALELGLEVRTVPSMTDLLDGTVDAYRIRPVRVEDLLRRPAITESSFVEVEGILSGKAVVITGAGGSIGSELARQVYAMGPRRLVLVDRAESPLYLIQRELEVRGEHLADGPQISVHLASVASAPSMNRILREERPSVIFHAAAYKHVPMLQAHPSDAAYVNVHGTMVLLDAAMELGVERFVFVSTDKAVRPVSVMGASKRIAEMLVADAARRTGSPYVSVRFGNVLGSNGSVIPIFQQQLESGAPLTITHPDMTRFFMTIPEACRLILRAGAIGVQGDLFVLDMGEPVRVLDLARDLVRLAGRDPDTQPMEIMGLRPGERLHEELFYDTEEVEPTSSEKVLRARATPPPLDVRVRVERILKLANGEHEQELAVALLDYARQCDGKDVVAVPIFDDEENTDEALDLLMHGNDGEGDAFDRVRLTEANRWH